MSEVICAGKTCTKCRESKPRAEFCKDRSSKDGLFSHCKGCNRQRLAAWYAANAERHRANAAAWVKANPERYRTNTAKRSTRDTKRGRRYARALKYFEGRPRWVSLITACLLREKRLRQMEWMVPSLTNHLATQEI
jgi:hypothetical protein